MVVRIQKPTPGSTRRDRFATLMRAAGLGLVALTACAPSQRIRMSDKYELSTRSKHMYKFYRVKAGDVLHAGSMVIEVMNASLTGIRIKTSQGAVLEATKLPSTLYLGGRMEAFCSVHGKNVEKMDSVIVVVYER